MVSCDCSHSERILSRTPQREWRRAMARHLGRWKASDAIGLRAVPARRSRDQDPEEGQEPEGELPCRLMEGRDGAWFGHDGGGRVLRVKRGRDGALEIRHMAKPAADEAAEEIVGTYPGGELGDPARAARSSPTGDALQQW